MPVKGIAAERDALVEEQLRSINEKLSRLEQSLDVVQEKLDDVRTAELAAIRSNVNDLRMGSQTELAKRDAEIGKHEAELKLLRYQMGRTTAVWSLVSGGVGSAIVAALMALLLKR